MTTPSATVDALMALNRGAYVPDVRPLALRVVSRKDLPRLCRDLRFMDGAEIGVWKGAYSASFCAANPKLRMRCVDPWLSYPAWTDTKNALSGDEAEAFMASAYQEACTTLKPFPNAKIVRKFSVEAAADVADASLDFIYVDGNHVEQAVFDDLTAWAPKVRSGGFVAGHDFREFPNKPFVQVIPAVTAYVEAHAIDPWFVLAADRTPSFLWVVQ